MDLVLSSFPCLLAFFVWYVFFLFVDSYDDHVISGLRCHVLAQYGHRNCAAVLKGFEVLRRRPSLPARSAPGPSMWKGLGLSMWKGSGPGTTQFHVLAQSGSWKTCFFKSNRIFPLAS